MPRPPGVLETHCRQLGHRLSPDNIRWADPKTKTRRKCKACVNIRQRLYYARKKNQRPTFALCKHGHPIVGENAGKNGNRVRCRKCWLHYDAQRKAEKRRLHREQTTLMEALRCGEEGTIG